MPLNPEWQEPNRPRFKVGNPGGPGRLPRTREAEIYQNLLGIFTPDVVEGMQRSFGKKLKEGNAAALREIIKYILPTVQRTEHTGADGEPLLPISQVIAALQELERQQQAGKQPGPDAAK